MERFGVVLVAAFAAGMLCGPVGCVIYSRLRRHRRFKPGPRQLKNARKQLVAVAECSSRLGAQKWETAISTRTTSSSDGGADQAGPRSGQWLRGAEDESNGGRFGVGAGGDEAAMASLECSICIGPLFPQGPDDGQNAADNQLTLARTYSTRAAGNDNDSAALLSGGEPRGFFWNRWARAIRQHVARLSSPSTSAAAAQPEMATTHEGRLLRGNRGGQSNGGEVMHPQADDRERRVHTEKTESSTAEKGVDTPDFAMSDGAGPGCCGDATSPPRSGQSQDGNVLEGETDSHAKRAMTPVWVATPATGSTSAAQASSAPAQPPVGQPVTLTAPAGGAAGGAADGTAGPRDARSHASSTEPGRTQPSTTPERPGEGLAVGCYSFPRRPVNAVKRAGRGVLTFTRNVSGRSSAEESDLDTEILVLRGCHHAFHARCLISWFLADGFDCPVCRAPYWMRREQMARAMYNERNGIAPEPQPDPVSEPSEPRWSGTTVTRALNAGMGISSPYVRVRSSPGRPVYPTDHRAWEVYIP